MSKPDTTQTNSYDDVLDAVAECTDAETPLASRPTVLAEAVTPDGPDAQTVHAVLARAQENDDLLSWHGKLACTDTESLRAVADAETSASHPRTGLLRRIVSIEAGREHTDPSLIAQCNRVLHGGDE